MTLDELQILIERMYSGRDRERGTAATFLWLCEEIGELAKCFNKSMNKNEIESEFADIFAWLCSVANLLNIDLEQAIIGKYDNSCPRCKNNHCNCEF